MIGELEKKLVALVRFAYQLTHDRWTAEDLVQEAITRVRVRSQRHGVILNLGGYLRTVIVRWFLSRRSRGASTISGSDRWAPAPGPDVADRVAASRHGGRRFAQLPLRRRTVLVLTYYGHARDEEIARQLRCAVTTVRSLRSRGLASLRASTGATDEK